MQVNPPLPPARDLVAPAALAAFTVWDVSTHHSSFPTPLWLSGSLLVGACVALVVRRTAAATACVAASALVSTCLLLQRDLTQQPAIEPFLIVIVAFFNLGLHASGRGFAIGSALAGSLLVAVEGLTLAAGRPWGETVPSLVFWAAAAAVGRLVHRHRREATVATELASESAAQERARIARELHDVVAHSLSVMVIQASVEARLIPDRESSAAQTLRTIEETGRQALADLRRLLGLLRTSEESVGLAPMPTLDHVETLVQHSARAGLDVRMEVTGKRRELPAGIDLSAYRIVQEALTNASRHAPGSQVVVRVSYGEDAVGVEVEDDGGETRTNSDPTSIDFAELGGRHGLTGMRERVRLYDGHLDVGRREQGGFRVRASFPVGAQDR